MIQPASLRLILLTAFTCSLIAQAAKPPRAISAMDESPILVRLPNRTLGAWLIRATAEYDQVLEIVSTDNGRTWSAPRAIHVFPEKPGSWGGPEPLVNRNGKIHLFLLRYSKYTLGNRGEAERPVFDDYSGNRIDIWHMKSDPARTEWTKPKEIWAGYTGALNSVLQMRSGRILLPFSYFVKRKWSDCGKGFAEFTFLGHFNCTLVYSDDHGEKFHLSPLPANFDATLKEIGF